ncbi:MAG TPA: TIGR02757 family protein [Bdellovibrionales bacterium]|nr:TIGR02757 family protein [Bdellovibrionales bacterium]
MTPLAKPLATFLDRLVLQYHRRELLNSDPLEFMTRYPDPYDQEVVGLIAALLAYGNVVQIRRSVSSALERMALLAERPADFAGQMESPAFRKKAEREFQSWVHRFNTGADLLKLLGLLSRSWSTYGTLGAHFTKNLAPADKDISGALNLLIADWSAWSGGASATPGLRFFLTAPASGSCCKRWCMFLRWMGRSDSIDPGLWTQGSALCTTFPAGRFLAPHQLIMPMDTHVSRISRYLRLTERKATDWKTALEVTSALRGADPQDPVRYDFALSRLGILDVCTGKYLAEICKNCQIRPVCHVGSGKNPVKRKKFGELTS